MGSDDIWGELYLPSKHDSSFYSLIHSIDVSPETIRRRHGWDDGEWEEADEAWKIGDDRKSLKGNQLPAGASVDRLSPTVEIDSGPLTFEPWWMSGWITRNASRRDSTLIFRFSWIRRAFTGRLRYSEECSIMIWICVRLRSLSAHMWIGEFIVLWNGFIVEFVIARWRLRRGDVM